jgi:RNA polymerase primary sigma factor
MQDMDEQEVMVLKMRYGLDEYEPKTLKEISETLCMTRDRVRQIEANALARLYDSLNGIQRRIDKKQR